MASASSEVKAISIPSTNKAGSCPGYLFGPASSQAGLIVLQEWWGVNDQIKSRAAEFGAQGIISLIPDLYRGKVATNHEEAGHLMGGLDWQGAVVDVEGAAKYLLGTAKVSKVFVVGYCMGGALSLASSILLGKTSITGGIVFYGIPSDKLASPSKLQVPIQCHFGTKDSLAGFSDSKAQDALEEELKKTGVAYEFYRYEGLAHAFTNHTGQNYNKEGANLAFNRTLSFIQKYSK